MPDVASGAAARAAAVTSELNELLWALPATLDPYAIVAALLERSARLFEAPLACVWLKEGDDFELAGCYGFTEKKGEQLREGLGLAGRAPVEKALSGSELAALSGFGKRRLGALVAQPLLADGRLLGWAAFARLEPRPFTDLEQQFMAMIGSRVSVAIDNATRYQATLTRSQELELLYEIASLLVGTIRLDELLSRLVRRMTETFNLTGSMLRLVDPASGTVPVRALYHRDPEEQARLLAFFGERPLAQGEGRTGQLLARKQPYVGRNLLEDPVMDPSYKEALGPGSIVAAPLAVRGKVIGVLFWYRASKQRPLNDTMVPLVSHLANQIAIAIDNAQLVSEMERQIAAAAPDAGADKETLASALETSRTYITRMAQDVRNQIHGILGLAGLIEHALEAPSIDRASSLAYLERLMTQAEAINERLDGWFTTLKGEAPPDA